MENKNYQIDFSQSKFRWLAVSILLVDYFLVSQGYIDGKSVLFNLLNAVGSLILIVNSLAMKPKDWAVATFNAVWMLIAIITILRQYF